MNATGERYNVKWRRPGEPEILECRNLSAELLAFRIRAVIRMCGGVELLSLDPVQSDSKIPVVELPHTA